MAMTPTGKALNLQDYVRILRQRKWVVVLFVVLAVLASLGYCKLQESQYTATSQLLLTSQLSSTILQATNPGATTSGTDDAVDVPTDTQVIESASVKQGVAKSVSNPPNVTVAEVGATDVVNISTTSTNPVLAAKAANAYAYAYLAVQQSQSKSALTRASKLGFQPHTICSQHRSLNSTNRLLAQQVHPQ